MVGKHEREESEIIEFDQYTDCHKQRMKVSSQSKEKLLPVTGDLIHMINTKNEWQRQNKTCHFLESLSHQVNLLLMVTWRNWRNKFIL